MFVLTPGRPFYFTQTGSLGKWQFLPRGFEGVIIEVEVSMEIIIPSKHRSRSRMNSTLEIAFPALYASGDLFVASVASPFPISVVRGTF